ncbi:MAG: ABC transporter permease, partial [Deltaproteobacteria bacterium]
MIAWRYLRASRTEGGVSVLTWISLIGIALAVFALIVVMAVRSGFRAEFVDTILGANAHVTVYAQTHPDANGRGTPTISDYETKADALRSVPGVTRVAPLIRAQVLASSQFESSGAEVYGISRADLLTLPRIAHSAEAQGDIMAFDRGIALGAQLARTLGVIVGDKVKILSPDGAASPFGRAPRTNSYEVVYIFTAGRYDIDRTRIYLPIAEAQTFFNKDGMIDEFEVMVADPEHVEDLYPALITAGGDNTLLWSWKDSSGSFLRALTVEDNVMWVVMGVLVLIATMNIISGLIMLVKNKNRDIGILRTVG